VSGQLDQVPVDIGTGVPADINQTLDGNGSFTATVTIGTASMYMNLFAQAEIGSTPVFTNCVNIWVTN